MTRSSRNKKILEAIQQETTRALETPRTARDTLIKEKIYTKKGKLRSEFGGSGAKREVAIA